MTTRVTVIPIARGGKAQVDVQRFQREARQVVNNVTADGKRFIASYPSQTLVKTGYRRTGTLKRSWSSRTRTTGQRIEGVVGSNSGIAPYNRFVQGGPKEQARLFKNTSWRTAPELADEMEDDFLKDMEGVVRRVLE